MNIKQTAKKIEGEGYKVSLLEKNFLIAGIKDERPIGDDGIGTLSSAFNISLIEGRLLLEYANHQLSNEKLFGTEEELLDFIKKQFPVKSK